MAADEGVLFRSDWTALGPLALKDVVVVALAAALTGVVDGSLSSAVTGFAIILLLAFGVDAFRWWRELGGTTYSVADDSLVVRTRTWSRSYPLAEIESAEVVGAATWRHSVFRLDAGFQPVFPQVRLQVRREPVLCPPVGVWGVEGAAALQRSLDAAVDSGVADRQRA